MFIFVFLSLAWAQTCTKYACAPPNSNSECVHHNTTTQITTLSGCSDPRQHCPHTSIIDSYCIDDDIQLNYPGDYCYSDADCASKDCRYNKCVGASIAESCDSLYGCNPGLFCNTTSMLCQAQRKLEESCSLDWDCVNSATCQKGVCVQYLSLDIHEPVNDPSPSNINLACKSAWVTRSLTGNYICAEAPSSGTKTIPIKCEPGTQCVSSDGSATEDCRCGYNSAGSAYCPLFPGDIPFQEFITSTKSYISYNSDCNTYGRFSASCFPGKSQAAQLAFYSHWLKSREVLDGYYPLLQYNPDCVKETLLADYYEVKTAQDNIGKYTCPKYVCANDTSEWEQDQCIFYDKNLMNFQEQEILYIKNCTTGQECQPTRQSNSTCTIIDNFPGPLPGDFCDESVGIDCQAESFCIKNRCFGLAETYPCHNTYGCSAGLYCSFTTLTCTKQKSIGQTCSDTFECVTNALCDGGKCVQYFSKSVGATTSVGIMPMGYSNACSSGFATYDSKNAIYTCAAAPTSSKQPGAPCNPGDMCQSTDLQYSQPCTCGYNADGISYCPFFEGDEPLQKAISHYRSIQIDGAGCNTASRLTEACFTDGNGVYKDYFYFTLNFFNYTMGPQLVNNPSCVASVYTNDYWTEYEHYLHPINPDIDDDQDDDHPQDDNDDSSDYAMSGLAICLLAFIF